MSRFLLAALVFLFVAARGEAQWTVQERTVKLLAGGHLRHVHAVVAGPVKVTIEAALFQQRDLTFRVADNPNNAQSLAEVMLKTGALAGVNGGFFHPDQTPLGLVISGGRRLHPVEKAKLLSGLVLVSDQEIRLVRSGEYSARPRWREALQAGPFLVDRGAAVPGLNRGKSAVRTVVISDGKGGCGILVGRSASLAEAAQILAQPGLLPGFKIVRALNLDGGSSSAFYLRDDPPLDLPGWKAVRNFLIITPLEKR